MMKKENLGVLDLPYAIFSAVGRSLERSGKLQEIISSLPCVSNQVTADDSRFSPGEKLLFLLGNYKKTVKDLLKFFDEKRLEEPQMILRRKYHPIRIIRQSLGENFEVVCGDESLLKCEAIGFPYPRYQWFLNDVVIDGATESSLAFTPCCCEKRHEYHCIVTNEVKDSVEWTSFYAKFATGSREKSPIYVPKITCNKVHGRHLATCDDCVSVEKMCMLEEGLSSRNAAVSLANETRALHLKEMSDSLVASDKVALIIGNSEYQHLPRLSTPACDAQALAEALLNCDFKTVTLADLTLKEMRSIVAEYCRLLGSGVYAVFYFVGHGFEVSGQCYLLPVDAPDSGYTCDDCLCAEEVLMFMQETDPALNVVLLDMCRRMPSAEELNKNVKIYKPKVNRNTVFGYATSFGEGAYEIKGEMNGIFMKHLKKHVESPKPITDVLNRAMRDLEEDAKANDAQFPEIRTNLTRPRCLQDDIDYSGHTNTFDCRTLQWQEVHELPDPIKIQIDSLNLLVMIWFDFCGHFLNMVYAFTTVYSMCKDVSVESSLEIVQDEKARQYLAYLSFAESAASTNEPIVFNDDETSKTSVRILLRNLQRFGNTSLCTLHVRCIETNKELYATDVNLGRILISKLDTLFL